MAGRRNPSSPGRRTLFAVLAVTIVTSLVVGAWAADTGALGGDVVRNVSLGEIGLGGTSRADVEAAVADYADAFTEVEVRIGAGAKTYTSTAGALGLEVDEPATVAAILDTGRTGAWPVRPLSWIRSFVSPWDVAPVVRADAATLDRAVADLQGDDLTPPIEPSMRAAADGLVLVPGVAGSGIDGAALAPELVATATAGEDPIVVRGHVGAVPPQTADADVQAIVDEGNRLSAAGLGLTVNGTTRVADPNAVRSWLALDNSAAQPALGIDTAAALTGAQLLFPDVAAPATDARFDVVDGRPVLQPSQDGTACCEADTGDRVLAALQAGATQAELALVVSHPAITTEAAQALGIVEEVGQPDAFGPTTHHEAGQARVTNIHRIADILRGVVIKPGETFSVNTYVGERTVDKGFVDAPVIYEGEFTSDVGGGVSQFATTFFNAALFAGLDFGEYQSHSIQIGRYPAGHEATISYPHPDLQIENTTPYGILVWPTYTDSSITVHLYSTHFVDVSLGAPSTSPAGNCTRWTTPRTRTYVDGHVESDSVHATYRPSEGVSC